MNALHPILVTGASRGIGRAIVLTLAAAGWPTIGWARSADDLGMLAAAATGPVPIVQSVDLADPDAIARAVRDLHARGIAVGSVVLNAGVGRWMRIADQGLEDWRHTQRVNVDGHYALLREVLPAVRATPGGMIVGVLSDSALYPFAGRSAYAASKAALHMLLDSVRREVRADGTRVTLLFPGRVDTHFQGSRATAAPGARPGALGAADVADAVAFVVARAPGVEIREIRLASLAASYGPYEEIAR